MTDTRTACSTWNNPDRDSALSASILPGAAPCTRLPAFHVKHHPVTTPTPSGGDTESTTGRGRSTWNTPERLRRQPLLQDTLHRSPPLERVPKPSRHVPRGTRRTTVGHSPAVRSRTVHVEHLPAREPARGGNARHPEPDTFHVERGPTAAAPAMGRKPHGTVGAEARPAPRAFHLHESLCRH